MADESREVQQARKRVDSLRAKVLDERAKTTVVAQQNEDTVRLAGLEAEETRLQAELDALKSQNSRAAVKEAVQPLVEQVKEGGTAPAEIKREDA